jgi:hypothetical protein
MRLRAALAAIALAAAGCSHRLEPPSSTRWGLPVYPRASAQGVSSSTASFALYSTSDRFDDVYAWYESELPPGTPHAYSSARSEATFALFDARSQRTVHLETHGATTTIMLTDLQTSR